MEKIKINFVDFWDNLDKTDNYFYHLLSMKYKVVIDEDDPDLLFFSVDYAKRKERDRYINHRCRKIFYTGENVSPNFDFPGSIEYPRYSIGKADFAFSFEKSSDPRNYRFPLWAMFINWFDVPHKEQRDQSYLIPVDSLLNRTPSAFPPKNKFCNFVFSNNTGKRLEILDAVGLYKTVHSAGRLANNMGYCIKGRGDQKSKVDFLSSYKFTIAAENTKNDGYTTEKIVHPLSVGSIPIYWGSNIVGEDFNEECFINVDNFSTLKELIERVIIIDNDDALCKEIISKPVFKNNQIPESVLPENILKFFEEKILC